MTNRKILTGAILINAVALVALLVYSIERTSWLFDLFENWSEAAIAAAIVVEVCAVALLVGAGALAHLDKEAREWANRALVAVLSVQALANLSAGYLRGGRETLALFAGDDGRASYAVAATLWFSVNLAVPGLILCLSKLLERLIAAWQTSTDAPLREQVRELRDKLANEQAMLAGAMTDLALAREEANGFRERLSALFEQAATEGANTAQARERAASAEATAANSEREIARLRESLAEAREQIMVFGDTPPTQARIVAYVREQQATGRALLDIARELGFSESTVRGWLKPATNGHLIEEVA